MFSKISRLDRAIQAAQRHQVKANLPVELTEQILEEAGKIEQRLIKLIGDSSTAKASGKYSQAGLAEKVATFQEETRGAYARLNKLESFDATIKSMEIDRLNRSVTERTKHIPPDPALAYHIGKEIRDSLSDVRKQAEAAREPGKPYQDPIEALYLKCCHEYTGDKEPFIQAVSNAPYPIALLSEDIVDKGRQIIRKVISPELSHAIECQRCLKAMFSELDQAVQEIIADPLRQAVRREEHMAVADGTARIVAG